MLKPLSLLFCLSFLGMTPVEATRENFSLHSVSKNHLRKVHPDLVKVTIYVLQYSPFDFQVIEGIRSPVTQKQYAKEGLSHTISKHLAQRDGYGHAIDIVPIVNGKPDWGWNYIFPIADAMRVAAKHYGVRIIWGGGWVELNQTEGPLRDVVEAYKKEMRGKGKSILLDGVHFEIKF